jgi:hypothetical protein
VRYLRLKRYGSKNFASFPFEISHGKNFFRPVGGGILAAAAEKNFASFPLSEENFKKFFVFFLSIFDKFFLTNFVQNSVFLPAF